MSTRGIVGTLLVLAWTFGVLAGSSFAAEAGNGNGNGLGRANRYWRGEREVTPGPFLCTAPAATDVVVVNDRWPDTSDMRQFGLDAIRLSAAETETEKCLAVFRWLRRVYLNGDAPFEPLAPGPDHIRWNGYFKWLHCYGVHYCSGMGRALEMHWRALGYPGAKTYAGHTLANVYHVDPDGLGRWHHFDVNRGRYMLDRSGKRLLSLDDLCVDSPNGRCTAIVQRPQAPWSTHRSELSLRTGERLERLWGIDGPLYQKILWVGRTFKGKSVYNWFKQAELGPYQPTDATGTWTYAPDLSRPDWTKGLAEAPAGMAAGKTSTGSVQGLAPAKAGAPASAVWHFRTPYIVSGAEVELDLARKSAEDTVRLLLSVDGGKTWKPAWECPAEKTGERKLTADICPKFNVDQVRAGKETVPADFSSPFGRYSYRVKLELVAAGDAKDCRVKGITFRTNVQQNMRALPQLQPGRNRITVKGKLAAGGALRVTYVWDDPAGKGRRNVTVCEKLPHTYEIIAAGKKWEDCVCKSILVEAVPAGGEGSRTLVKEQPSEIHKLPAMPSVHGTCDTGAWGITKRDAPAKLPPFEKVLERLNMKTDRRELQSVVIPQLIEYADPRAVAPLKAFIPQCTTGKYAKCQKFAVVALHASEPDREKFRAWLKSFAEDTKVPNFSEGVVAAMARFHNWPEFIPYLVKEAGEKTGASTLIGLFKTFAAIGDKRCAPAVKRILAENKDTGVLALAVLAAGRTGDRSTIPVLRGWMRKEMSVMENYRPAKINAAVALGMLKDTESIPEIRALLKHRPIEMWRAKAAMSLAFMGEKSSIPALRAAMDDEPVRWVREVMKKSIEALEAGGMEASRVRPFNGLLEQ